MPLDMRVAAPRRDCKPGGGKWGGGGGGGGEAGERLRECHIFT